MGVVSKNGNVFQEKNWVGYLPTPYHHKPHQFQPFKKVLSHFPNTNSLLNLTPTKVPTTIEIPTHINPSPQTDLNPEYQNSPKPQNN